MKKNILYIITFLFLILNTVSAQTDIPAKLDKLVDDYYNMNLFSGTVLVVQDDSPIFRKAVGYSNKENNSLNNAETVFNIGSIQKTFTQELIKMLIEEGKLKYGDKLGQYITGFSDKEAENATIEQILSMKGGFGDFVMIPEIQMNAQNYSSIYDFLGAIKTEPLRFKPGTDRQYSNSGYVILGGVIEKVTGKSYEEFLTERLLKPLGMEHSYYVRGSVSKPNKASGYVVSPDGTIFQPRGFDLAPTPAGSMYSNLDDLMKFADYLWGKSNGPVNNAFAGGLPGWNSVMGMFGEMFGSKETTVIILSNFDEPSAEQLFDQVIKVLKGKDYEPAKKSLGSFVYNEIKNNGAEYFITNYTELLSDNGYEIENDMTLNRLGYNFLNQNMNKEAIAVLSLNVKLFPKVANCYDSLGEAYMMSGNKTEAIKNYEIVLQMDPENRNAKMMLEKLTSQ